MLGPKGYKGKYLPMGQKAPTAGGARRGRAAGQTGPLNKRAAVLEVRLHKRAPARMCFVRALCAGLLGLMQSCNCVFACVKGGG